MRKWFKQKRRSEEPYVCQTTIGTLRVTSGSVLLADPMHVYDADSIEEDAIKGVPAGQHAVHAQIIHYPEGGQRVAKIGLFFGPPPPDSRRQLAEVAVDSATVVVVDAQACKRYWKHVGPERVGRITIPEREQLARQIGRRFALTPRSADGLVWEFEEPISERLEAQVLEYLKTVPECAEFPSLYFSVRTRNSRGRVQEAMRDMRWCEVVLDESSGASLVAVQSGFGDGGYPVEGLYRSGQLIGVEVEFIGPAQDKLLEAFPVLRY